mmetsp:Transcript_81216/g.161551  ORF Transcript_81216/g.161551 Transcript_81216/m.161551 type:complete len:284 (+) Transcript_81216:368-1219(+)
MQHPLCPVTYAAEKEKRCKVRRREDGRLGDGDQERHRLTEQKSDGTRRECYEGAGCGDTNRMRLLLLLLLGEAILLPDAEEAIVGARHADGVEGVRLLHLLRNGHRLGRSRAKRRHGHQRALKLFGLVEVGGISIARLRLATLAGEDYQLRFELLEALRVHLQRLRRAVAAAVVNSNSNGARLLTVDAGLLQLSEGEAAPLAQLVVAFDRRGVHDWPQQASRWAGRHSSSLLLAQQPAALLARRLVEPCADVVLLADLMEVLVGNLIVVLHHSCKATAARAPR